jgi:hypothetical protein
MNLLAPLKITPVVEEVVADKVRLTKVGEEMVAISCGVDNVTAPDTGPKPPLT